LATVVATVPELQSRRFLFPRARTGREAVLSGLVAHGARVDTVTLYDTLPITSGPALPAGVHWLTFMSPSAVEAFHRRAPLPPGIRIACIGPTTAAAVAALGWRVDAVAEEQSVEAMLAAMAAA
jgi:uroporphyrinogen-III synthase